MIKHNGNHVQHEFPHVFGILLYGAHNTFTKKKTVLTFKTINETQWGTAICYS